MPNTHRRRDATVELRRVGVGGASTFATSSRRLPTDSVDNLNAEHSGLTTWILIDIDNFFNNDVIMSSLVTNLNSLDPWHTTQVLGPSFSHEKLARETCIVCHAFSYEIFLVRETWTD